MSAKVKATSFTYEITGVPDFDQRWDVLPEDGANYCVPTSTMNWIHYLAKHGWPLAAAIPIANDKDTTMIHINLTLMAGYMDTDPLEGTSGDDAFEGLVDYLDDRWVPAVVTTDSASDSGAITLDDLEALALMKGLVVIGRGRYLRVSDVFLRTGGHAMSLVGLTVKGSAADIEVRDPADDSANLHTQSARVRTKGHIKSETRNIDGDTVKVLRWDTSTDPYQFIDGWKAIVPSFALTNPTAKVILAPFREFRIKGHRHKDFHASV